MLLGGLPTVAHAQLDLRSLGSFALATAATFPFDARIAEAARDARESHSALLDGGAKTFNTAGDPGALIAALAMYGVGHVTHSPTTISLGQHATEAVVLAGTITAAGKLLAGRQRPNVEAGDADDFVPARGYRAGRTSFPSGHTTVAFAFASAVSSELRARHARSANIVGPLLFGAASLVGAARVYSNAHWASDVVIGAGVGTIVGHAIVAHAFASHAHGAHGEIDHTPAAAAP